MKKVFCFILCFLFLFITWTSARAEDLFEIQDIGYGYMPNSGPRINNHGQVIWSGVDFEQNQSNVFYFDGETSQQIIGQGGSQTDINDKGDVVWNGKVIDDGVNVFTVGINPAINNKGNIAWREFPEKIKFYDKNTVSTIFARSGHGFGWGVDLNNNDHIAFSAGDGWGRNRILFYDGETNQQIFLGDEYYPRINDNDEIVWKAGGGARYYDGNAQIDLSQILIDLTNDPNARAEFPVINNKGDIAFFASIEGEMRALYLYDGITIYKVSENVAASFFMDINDKREIAWNIRVGNKPEESRIYKATPLPGAFNNKIMNGDFDEPNLTEPSVIYNSASVPEEFAWSIETETVNHIGSVWNGVSEESGDQSAEILNNACLVQEFITDSGQAYTLNFWYAHDPEADSASADIIVEGNEKLLDITLDHYEESTFENMMFLNHTNRFIADSETTKISFCGYEVNGEQGFVIDRVKVYPLDIYNPLPDFVVTSSDIRFSPINPDPNQEVTITARITNIGQIIARDIPVNFYDFEATEIGQDIISSLLPGQSAEASITVSYPLEPGDPENSFRLITVSVDPDETFRELKEDNNEASLVLQVGEPDYSTADIIVTSAPVTACEGQALKISGTAKYVFSDLALEKDFPVQGGAVTVRLIDTLTTDIIREFKGGTSDINGVFHQMIIAPEEDRFYLEIEITDKTIVGNTEVSLNITGPCPEPPIVIPGPGGQPDPDAPPGEDVYVLSQHINFIDDVGQDNSNPEIGDTIQILAFINYIGEGSVSNIPITINDIYPLRDDLYTFEVGRASVSFPDGEENSPVTVSVPWTVTAGGAHVIQVITEPPIDQYTGNDKATRSIFAGSIVDAVDIFKSVVLWGDKDGNLKPSPGDVLKYSIEYVNNRALPVTTVKIIDDYDEGLLGLPFNISSDGSVENGTVIWNLRTLNPGDNGVVTFETEIFPYGIFPDYDTFITNTAVMTTDQTNPVHSQAEIRVFANRPPAANAGDDQTVECTSSDGCDVTLDGSGSSDPDGDSLTYSWTNTSGVVLGVNPMVTVSLPLGSHTITLTVDDGNGGTDSDTVQIIVEDTTPPDLSVSVDPDVLWPPNHNMIQITPTINVNDICDSDPTVVLKSITMNEGDETDTFDPNIDENEGDGNTSNDIEVDEDGNIFLRAERAANNDGRIYTITYAATDTSGNSTEASVTVTVPHNQ